jgi:hypothetical protein
MLEYFKLCEYIIRTLVKILCLSKYKRYFQHDFGVSKFSRYRLTFELVRFSPQIPFAFNSVYKENENIVLLNIFRFI